MITHVGVGGKILGEDHDPHKQSIQGCGLPGRITCRRSNPNFYSKTSPLHGTLEHGR